MEYAQPTIHSFFLGQPFCTVFMSNSRQSVEPRTAQRNLLWGEVRVTPGRWTLHFPSAFRDAAHRWWASEAVIRETWELTSFIWRDPGHESRERWFPLCRHLCELAPWWWVYLKWFCKWYPRARPLSSFVSARAGSRKNIQSSFALGSRPAMLSACWLPSIWTSALVKSFLMTP